MSYRLEELGPDRFQQLCQSLLAREYSNLQCFPVSQADGGRDATSRSIEANDKGHCVYQVKFVKNPFIDGRPHQRLLREMEQELANLPGLVGAGAASYHLITNVPGTAARDRGSIDRLTELLESKLPVPCFCWWRDDIERRLDNSWDLKWAYPELLRSQDLIRYLIEVRFGEKKNNSRALRAFLTSQYDDDKQIRFKQVDLQNNLLDLFVDLPIDFDEDTRTQARDALRELARDIAVIKKSIGVMQIPEEVVSKQFRYFIHDRVDAASLILHPKFASAFPRVVIEGAPGQGKSTIAQYVCQVHRMKFLGMESELNALPSEHRNTSPRLPIKVDLRDFAVWLSRKDPFVNLGSDLSEGSWNPSMESFLAALVRHCAGGIGFTVDDLVATIEVSSVLLVFDGLDEVADIAQRKLVIDEIIKGVQRLSANALGLQTIVTSRPAAFANSPGMPKTQFPHLRLQPLGRAHIDRYTSRWLKARGLTGKDSQDIKDVLDARLSQRHIEDLARNPMQLAILLTLILTRGVSLPDKRSLLYFCYVDLFFNREAEKNEIVREYRDILIDIHQYLGWTLQCEAEKGMPGRITYQRLMDLVGGFLSEEGRPAELAKTLFNGLVERVVAIVSRYEGTYEFDVQPLREYFAAKFLYETSPTFPYNNDVTGTRADRFEALTNNFYWLNVTRYYAGFFGKMEVPALVDRIEAMSGEKDFSDTSRPWDLACTLLADWVFSQHPRSVEKVLDLITKPTALRRVLVGELRRSYDNVPFELSDQCGRERLLERIVQALRQNVPRDFARGLCALGRRNSSGSKVLESLWGAAAESDDSADRNRWIGYALELGVLRALDPQRLISIFPADGDRREIVSALYRAGRTDYLEGDAEALRCAIDVVLDGPLNVEIDITNRNSPLQSLLMFLSPVAYALALSDRRQYPFATFMKRILGVSPVAGSPASGKRESPRPESAALAQFLKIGEHLAEKTVEEWATTILPWDTLVEKGRGLWGERLSLLLLGNIAAGIASTRERCSDAADLLDRSLSLCRRLRYARLRTNAVKWWERQLEAMKDGFDAQCVLLPMLTWSRPDVITKNIDGIEHALSAMSPTEWSSVAAWSGGGGIMTQQWGKSVSTEVVSRLPARISPRLADALLRRCHVSVARMIIKRVSSFDLGATALGQVLEMLGALDLQSIGRSEWNPKLSAIARLYRGGTVVEVHELYPYLGRNPFDVEHGLSNEMSLKAARAISSAPNDYPLMLLGPAQQRCMVELSKNVVPLVDVAEQNGWFRQQY